MTESEAKELLLHHSFQHDDYDSPKSEKGFLGSLRPFTGELYESNYDEVIEALKALSNYLRKSKSLDRQIMSSLWNICHLSRAWALDRDGMLTRNQLITSEQQAILETWVNNISYATTMLVSGADNETAFGF